MKIKTPNNFQPFKDGKCDIYTVDEENNKSYKYKGLSFDNRTLSYKRFYSAQAVSSDINRILRIQNVNGIDIHDKLKINGDNSEYDIDLIQEIYDTNPSCKDLTLRKVGIHG